MQLYSELDGIREVQILSSFANAPLLITEKYKKLDSELLCKVQENAKVTAANNVACHYGQFINENNNF